MAEVEFLDLKGEIKEDQRGFSFFPWEKGSLNPQEVVQTFHLVSIRPGQVRGNHLHPAHREWLYAFHGRGILAWEAQPGRLAERELAGGRTLVLIPPGIPHALRNPGPKLLYLLAWWQAEPGAPAGPASVPRTVL